MRAGESKMGEWREQLQSRQIWWIFMLRGVLAAGLGIFALFWPTLTLKIVVLLVGAYLIADGVMGLVMTLRRAVPSGRLLQPAVSVVIGLIVVLWPSQSVRTLFMVLGAGSLFMGISYVITARQHAADALDRQLMTTAGITAIVLGSILILWPSVAVVTTSWAIATAALLVAAAMIFLGVRFRQLGARERRIPPTGPAA
jgi:uncharacterized membrane protein HdeD (DUF308 family)